jgi:two-component system phosphate regulon response regulator PhoB
MQSRSSRTRSPVVLIVDDQEWSTRALESVLTPAGYEVGRAYTHARGLDRARAEPPDLMFINLNLPDGTGVSLCRALREDPHFTANSLCSKPVPGTSSRTRSMRRN